MRKTPDEPGFAWVIENMTTNEYAVVVKVGDIEGCFIKWTRNIHEAQWHDTKGYAAIFFMMFEPLPNCEITEHYF